MRASLFFLLLLGFGSNSFAVGESTLKEFADLFGQEDYLTSRPFQVIVTDLLALHSITDSRDGIIAFRKLDGLKTTNNLMALASHERSEARVPATFILAKVVDNTTVCAVIDRLIGDKNMRSEGRHNLLQVVNQVAVYATAEVESWIYRAVAQNKLPQVDKSETLLVNRIIENLSERDEEYKNSYLIDLDGGIDANNACLQLPEIKGLSN